MKISQKFEIFLIMSWVYLLRLALNLLSTERNTWTLIDLRATDLGCHREY